MNRIFFVFAIGAIVILEIFSLSSCTHSPIGDVSLIDTTTNLLPDETLGIPCDSNIIYFDQQILPILLSNCAIPECHSEDSAQDGVVLVSYESVMNTAKVKAFDLNDSELFEVI